MGLLSHPADFSGLHSIPLSETGELLHLLQIFWLLHALDCSNLLGIAFDSSLGNEKSQELAGWDPENTLLGVELDLICSQVCKVSRRSSKSVTLLTDFTTRSSTYTWRFLPS